MKVTFLLFLAMSCAASMLGTGYAAALDAASRYDAKHQTAGTPAGKQRDHRRASRAPSHARVAIANRPKEFPNSRKRLAAGNPRNDNVRQPVAKKTSTIAKKGSIQNKTVSGTPAVRPPHVFRSSALSPENVRHRGPNPAVIAGSVNIGSANSRTGNTGTINGTRMNRRP